MFALKNHACLVNLVFSSVHWILLHRKAVRYYFPFYDCVPASVHVPVLLFAYHWCPFQTSSLIRVFQNLPEATALGLVLSEKDAGKANLARLSQSWSRFILQQISKVPRFHKHMAGFS